MKPKKERKEKDVSALTLTAPLDRWRDVFLWTCGAIVVLRLVIWKFFRGADIFVKEDFSNMIVAMAALITAGAFFVFKFCRREEIFRTMFVWPLLLMLAAAGGSFFYSADPVVTLKWFLPLAASAAFFYVLADILDTPQRIRMFCWIMLACGAVTAAFAINDFVMLSTMPSPADPSLLQTNNNLYYILTRRRATSFIGWPNSLAGYLLLTLPLAVIWAVSAAQNLRRWALGMVLAVFVSGFLVTFSVLGWLSLFLSTLVMLPVFFTRFHGRLDRRWRLFSAGGAAVFLVLFAVVLARKDFMASMLPRGIYYENTFKLIAEKPFWGHGFGAFATVSKPMVTTLDGMTAYVHNTYLQWLVEAGVPGFLGVILFLVVFAVLARRVLSSRADDRDFLLRAAVVWGMCAFLIDNLFSFTWIKPNIAFHSWVMLAVLAALVPKDDKTSFSSRRDWRLVVLVAGCVIALFFVMRFCAGFGAYQQGAAAFQTGNMDRAGRAFVRASLWDPWSSEYPTAAGAAAVQAYRHTGREYFLRLAETNYLEAIRRQPRVYANYFILSRIYLVLGDQPAALRHAREAERLSPYEFRRDSAMLGAGGGAVQPPASS